MASAPQAQLQSRLDLLAYALFELDARARCLREPLLVFLVSLALFERGRPADREELLEACRDQFLSGDGLDRGQIERVVSASTKAGLLVDLGDGTVDLSDERRQQLMGAAIKIDAQRDEFHSGIRLSVELELGEELSMDGAEDLERALDDFIQRLFVEKGIALARMFGPGGKGFDETAGDHLTEKSLDALAADVATTSGKFERAQIAEGIRAGLLATSQSGQKYLAAVYQRTVASALLQQDPNVRKVKRELAKARVFYLDANVLIALLFPAHYDHERVASAVNAARDLGCKLVVSSFTADEFDQQMIESRDHFRRLEGQQNALGIVSDDILRSFQTRRAASPGLEWDAYFAGFHPARESLPEFGIEVQSDENPDARHDDRRDEVLAAVRAAKPESHEKLVDFDVNNLILIQRRRRQMPADPMGNRVWLITLDRSLKGIDQRLTNEDVFAVPSSKRIGPWTASLSPHLSPDDPDLGEYALHLLKSKLGLLAEDPVFADVNFLTTLEESSFDLQDLLGAGLDKALRIIIALQEKREIREVLGERPVNQTEYDEWASRFAEAVEMALEKLDRSEETEAAATIATRERDQALVREARAKKERDSVRRLLADLQSELGERKKRERSWLRRMVRKLLGREDRV